MTSWLKRIVLVGGLLAVLSLAYQVKRAATPSPKPDFTAKDLSGKPWSLTEHRGKRPVLVSFYATWCGPCQMEIPRLIEIQKAYAAKGLQVVVLTEEPADVIKPTPLADGPLKVLVEAGETFKAYGITTIPRTVFFDSDGNVAADIDGFNERALTGIESYLKSIPG